KMPVTDLLWDRMINTFWLSLATLIITYIIAIPLGIVSGRYNDTWADQMITGYTYVGFATPLFIFGLLMLWIFGFYFGWFPTGGSVAPGLESGTFEYVLSKLNHLLLPSIAMSLIATVNTVQYLRNDIIDTKQKDFIITARSKGAPESIDYNRHILSNSLLWIIVIKLIHFLRQYIAISLIAKVNIVKYLITNIIDTKQKVFIITDNSKESLEFRVYNRHILRNSLLPIAVINPRLWCSFRSSRNNKVF